jgi:hypothetical protein
MPYYRSFAPGQASYMYRKDPDNRDLRGGDYTSIVTLRYIPIIWAQHRALFQGHTTKKDISMLNVEFLLRITLKRSVGVIFER